MKKYAISMVILCVMALTLCGSVSAANQTIITVNNNVNLTVANDNGTRFNDYPTGTNINNTYNYFNPNQGASQGLNAFYITTSNTTTQGGVVSSNQSSGTFYLSDTGGRGWDDDGILMLAINGTIPDDFSITIISSGYIWTPVQTGTYPTYGNLTYYPVALNETFYKSDFIYGPQIWRPAPGANNLYPIFNNQDMTNTNNTFSLMFIDLYAGIIGTGTLSSPTYSGKTLNDNGMLKVQYIINNLPVGSVAVFDGYAYTVSSNQGQGIRWTNRLSASGSSGYTVNGQAPIANFTATPNNGNAPLNVQFTDASTGTGPFTYLWNFGDGSTSTEQNPTHTYTTPGNYTVTLTAINAAGSSTYSLNITALDVTAPTVSANPVGGLFNTTKTVTLTTDDNTATTYYTTDGTDPKTSSTRTVYNGPITINNTTTLQYAAVDAAGNWSPVYNQTYQIKSDVYVNVTASKTNPQVGDTVTYKFKLCNNGPGIAKDVVYKYTIPEGLEYAGAIVDQGTVAYNTTTRTVTWNLGDVTVGDPNLWLNLKVLSASSYNIQPTVTVAGSNLESNIGSLQINAISTTNNNTTTVNAATITKTVNASTTKTIPMQTTGVPLTGVAAAILLIGSGISLSRKK